MDTSIRDALVESVAEAQTILGGNRISEPPLIGGSPSSKRTLDSQGFQPEGTETDETSLLLDGNGNGAPAGADEIDDWEGVPWYRKPSVRRISVSSDYV